MFCGKQPTISSVFVSVIVRYIFSFGPVCVVSFVGLLANVTLQEKFVGLIELAT